jgi:hypothetical protein
VSAAHARFLGVVRHLLLNSSFSMGFFRRAKTKLKRVVNGAYDDCEQDLVQRRGNSHSQNHDRPRHHDVHDLIEHEARVLELPPDTEMWKEEKRGNKSVGESLASDDHFDLCVPIKNNPPRKAILRNRSGQGLMLLPNGRNFSKHISDSDSVSSVSYDSSLFERDQDENIKHIESQANKCRSNSRSIKTRHSKLDTIKQNNLQHPSAEPIVVTKKSPGEGEKQQSSSNCCCYGDNTEIDGDTLIPTSDKESVRGVKTRSSCDESAMNSTIPTYLTEYKVELHAYDPTNTNKKIHGDHPPSSFQKTNHDPFFLNLCGPRQLPPEDLMADSETKPYSSPPIYSTYEMPLQFEKKDRSLFDPYSNDDEEAQQGKRHGLMEHDDDEQGTIPTYMDEVQTTMALMEMRDVPVHADVRSGKPRYQKEYLRHYYHEKDGFNEIGYDASNEWRVRLPRNLPKVRNLARVSSLSRLRSLRSSSRSHRSGRSGRRIHRRCHAVSPREEHEYSNSCRRRGRSRGCSPGRCAR